MLTFDTVKFSKDANAYHARRKQVQARSALEIGISSSTFAGLLKGTMPSVPVALSVCRWMKKDINAYAKDGLPHGVLARWSGAHEDGRVVMIEHGENSASFVERNPQTDRVLNRGQANYGNGAPQFEKYLKDYLEQGFTETEHITA